MDDAENECAARGGMCSIIGGEAEGCDDAVIINPLAKATWTGKSESSGFCQVNVSVTQRPSYELP